jgi:tetratricopeptide (TPR) repeat protein
MPSGVVDRGTALRMAIERQRAGARVEAIDIYQRILAADPSFAAAWINLGVALRAEGQIAASVACLRRGVALQPEDAAARSNLGNALRAAGRLDEAAAAHEAAIALEPPAAGSFIYNHALVQRDQGRLDAALAYFDAAEAHGYDSAELKWDRALALLLRGDLRRGFAEYEWRWHIPDAKPRGIGTPVWNGEDLGGRTLLVLAEQGFGDTIQFVRYLPLIAARAARVIFECQAPLLRLFQGSAICGDARVVARDDESVPDHDAQTALLSLPRLTGTAADTVPSTTPYLTPPEGIEIPDLREGGIHVGIAWAGKPTHRNDRNRSMPLDTLAPLFEVPGTTFHSLQLGDRANALPAQGFTALVLDHRDHIQDFADSAALVAGLDLVIGVDTAVVHLAGALGRPVWTLLPFTPDWRWQTGREDSPWYPSMRLFRQSEPGGWDDVVTRVKAALETFVADGPRRPTPQ